MIATPLTPSDRYFFIHLPKTGGSSFEYNIYLNMNPSSIYNFTVDERIDVRSLSEPEKKRIRYVISKSYGDHQQFNGTFAYVSLVRHPVDRVLSEYFFSVASNRHFHFDINSANLSLIELCEKIPSHIHNWQTKMLGGSIENSVHTLEKAKDNISRYFLTLGTLDKFNEFLLLLKKTLGWEIIRSVTINSVVKKPSSSEIPNDVIDYLMEKNNFDMALYDFAERMFNEQLLKNGIDVAPVLEKQEVNGIVLRRYVPRFLTTRVLFYMALLLIRTGWKDTLDNIIRLLSCLTGSMSVGVI